VSAKGCKCFSCEEKGGLKALAAHLGIAQAEAEVEAAHWPATLENYAKAKSLPVDFLENLGLQTVFTNGKPAVRMPYYDRGGSEVAVRMRIALTGAERFRWRNGSKLHPYGLWKLPTSGDVIVVEGESDCHALWHHGTHALGIPGAQNWRPEWAAYLDGLTVYVWQEPDAAGGGFVDKISASLPDALVISAPIGRKDISECHVLGDDVPALLQQLRATARPYREIAAERRNEQAAQAKQAADRQKLTALLVFLGDRDVMAITVHDLRRFVAALRSQSSRFADHPLRREAVHRMLTRLKAKSGGVGPCNPHAFRHSFARTYLMSGGDLATLSQLMGHSDIATTAANYAVFLPGELQAKHRQHSVAALLRKEGKL
jgi:hypothetical protein